MKLNSLLTQLNDFRQCSGASCSLAVTEPKVLKKSQLKPKKKKKKKKKQT